MGSVPEPASAGRRIRWWSPPPRPCRLSGAKACYRALQAREWSGSCCSVRTPQNIVECVGAWLILLQGSTPIHPLTCASAIGMSFPPSLHCFTPLGHKEELSTVTLLNYVCLEALVGLCETQHHNNRLEDCNGLGLCCK